jgi:hypothetical protein
VHDHLLLAVRYWIVVTMTVTFQRRFNFHCGVTRAICCAHQERPGNVTFWYTSQHRLVPNPLVYIFGETAFGIKRLFPTFVKHFPTFSFTHKFIHFYFRSVSELSVSCLYPICLPFFSSLSKKCNGIMTSNSNDVRFLIF